MGGSIPILSIINGQLMLEQESHDLPDIQSDKKTCRGCWGLLIYCGTRHLSLLTRPASGKRNGSGLPTPGVTPHPFIVTYRTNMRRDLTSLSTKALSLSFYLPFSTPLHTHTRTHAHTHTHTHTLFFSARCNLTVGAGTAVA